MTSLLKHEDNLPLIAFTTLSPLAVGGLIGLLLEGASGFAPAVVFGVALLALAASVLHLGHPTRAYRALLGVATSWLSREVALFTLFLFCLFVYVLAVAVGPFQWLAPFAGIVGAAFGLLALFASGKLYQLQARPAWDHWTAVVSFPASAFSGGLPLGIFLAALALPANAAHDEVFGPAITAALVALVVSPVLTALRFGRLRKGTVEERESWRMASGRYLWVLILRVVGSAVAFALLMTGGPGIAVAWVAAAIGELAERALFFTAVVPVSMPARSGASVLDIR